MRMEGRAEERVEKKDKTAQQQGGKGLEGMERERGGGKAGSNEERKELETEREEGK